MHIASMDISDTYTQSTLLNMFYTDKSAPLFFNVIL